MTKLNPENCKNCSSKCAYDCAQLQYTIQNRTVLIISPLTSRRTSQLRCCLLEERGTQKSQTLTGCCSGNSHLVLCGVGIEGCNELVVDVESISLFQSVSSDGRSTVVLRCLPDHRHVVLPDVLHVQVGWFRRLLCNSHSVPRAEKSEKDPRTPNTRELFFLPVQSYASAEYANMPLARCPSVTGRSKWLNGLSSFSAQQLPSSTLC